MGAKFSNLSESCTTLHSSVNGEVALGRTIIECLRHHVDKKPDGVAFVFASTDGSRVVITWTELYERSRKMADYFIKNGVRKEDFVVISMRTCPEWLYVLFGAMIAGIRAVSAAFTYKDGSDVTALMDRLSTRSYLFLDPETNDSNWKILLKLVDNVADDGSVESSKLEGLQKVIFRMPPSDRPEITTVEKILTSDISKQTLPVIDENDVVYLFQTSGSTGSPKLAMHTHKSLLKFIRYIDPTVFPYEDILFNDRPFTWVGGFPFNVISGQTRVTTLGAYTSPVQRLQFFIDVVKKERCTSTFLVPPLILYLMRMKDQFGPDWPLKTVFTGGMPITKMFVECIGSLCQYVAVIYACTEALLLVANVVDDPEQFNDFFCGSQLALGDIKIADDGGNVLPLNRRGEIYLKTETVFKGYFKDEERMENAFSDGWYKTDDLGRMDANGNITVEGRKSDIILTGGITVTPSILEAAMKTCPGIENVAIVGIPDDVMYQLLCACVIVKQGSGLSEGELKSYCERLHNENTEMFNVLPKFYLILEKFPETYTGKVSKKDLTEIATKRFK